MPTTIAFGTSRETSDFIVDCLEQWWQDRRESHRHICELVINLDNGPELASGRTQFIKRLVEFADKYHLRIRLVYYPPYHSKYNSIERCPYITIQLQARQTASGFMGTTGLPLLGW